MAAPTGSTPLPGLLIPATPTPSSFSTATPSSWASRRRWAPTIDLAVRPVDVKGSATRGPGDPFEAYWAAICGLAGVGLRCPAFRGHDARPPAGAGILQRRLRGGPPRQRDPPAGGRALHPFGRGRPAALPGPGRPADLLLDRLGVAPRARRILGLEPCRPGGGRLVGQPPGGAAGPPLQRAAARAGRSRPVARGVAGHRSRCTCTTTGCCARSTGRPPWPPSSGSGCRPPASSLRGRNARRRLAPPPPGRRAGAGRRPPAGDLRHAPLGHLAGGQRCSPRPGSTSATALLGPGPGQPPRPFRGPGFLAAARGPAQGGRDAPRCRRTTLSAPAPGDDFLATGPACWSSSAARSSCGAGRIRGPASSSISGSCCCRSAAFVFLYRHPVEVALSLRRRGHRARGAARSLGGHPRLGGLQPPHPGLPRAPSRADLPRPGAGADRGPAGLRGPGARPASGCRSPARGRGGRAFSRRTTWRSIFDRRPKTAAERDWAELIPAALELYRRARSGGRAAGVGRREIPPRRPAAGGQRELAAFHHDLRATRGRPDRTGRAGHRRAGLAAPARGGAGRAGRHPPAARPRAVRQEAETSKAYRVTAAHRDLLIATLADIESSRLYGLIHGWWKLAGRLRRRPRRRPRLETT